MSWWYLSFAGGDWRGACIVRARDIGEAVREAWRRGCNPGGEVRGLPLRDDDIVPEEFTNILLCDADVAALDLLNGGAGIAQHIQWDEEAERYVPV